MTAMRTVSEGLDLTGRSFHNAITGGDFRKYIVANT